MKPNKRKLSKIERLVGEYLLYFAVVILMIFFLFLIVLIALIIISYCNDCKNGNYIPQMVTFINPIQ